MRDYEAIVAEIAGEKQAYHDAAPTAPVAELREREARIAALQSEATDVLRDGAVPCMTCGEVPYAMRKGQGIYEVGCLTCRPRSAPSPDDPRMVIVTQPRARGESPQAAVKAWNAGNQLPGA